MGGRRDMGDMGGTVREQPREKGWKNMGSGGVNMNTCTLVYKYCMQYRP